MDLNTFFWPKCCRFLEGLRIIHGIERLRILSLRRWARPNKKVLSILNIFLLYLQEVMVNETGFIRDIEVPEPAPCKLSPRDIITTPQPPYVHTKYKAIPDVVSKTVSTS